MTLEFFALKNFKFFSLRNFYCLSGGKNLIRKTNFVSARVIEILENNLKF